MSALLAAVLAFATFAAPASAQPSDTDGDNMPDSWEAFFGLNPNDPDDATRDPDGDGLTSAQEFAAGRHPFGLFARYFAEGSTGFFDTSVAVLNMSTTATAHVSVALLNESGGVVSHQIALAPRGRRSVSLDTILGTAAAVSIIVESDVPIAADRAMTWGTSGVGLSLDSGSAAPATTWYFAEGATGPFLLYYLFENPGATAANVTVRYLREDGAPISKTRSLPPHSRTTIFVNGEAPELAVSSLRAVVTSDVPILAERAMYVLSNGTFGGGSASSGSPTLSRQWYFGEGATGPFFHAFLSIINPGETPATATVTYHLSDGSTASKAYGVPAAGRRTLYFNDEAGNEGLAALAHGPVWFTVSSTQPILGERAMWWSTWPWYESHTAVGSTISDIVWGVAEGRHGGPMDDQTYVLVGNTTATPGQVRVSVIPDTGAVQTRDLAIAAGARLTINVGSLFNLPESRFSVIIESLGTTPVPLAVDYARYRSVNGLPFSGGGAAPAVPLQAADTPPSVTATLPADGATGASSTNNLVVTFNEPVAAAAGAFTLACPTGTIALTVVTASPASQFTLDPNVPLPALTTCTLTVLASAITDVDATDPANVMAADAVVSFTTATESAPAVSSTTPAAGATQIGLGANLTITFSEPVDVAGNWFQIICATSGTRGVADAVVTGGPTAFTINPNTDFVASETCTVTVAAAQVTDQDAFDPPETMVADHVFAFGADMAPTVTATTPSNGATSLGTTTSLSVTFSEPVTATGNWFQIVCATSGTRNVADTVVSGGPTSFTIDPNADFAPGEICTVAIAAAQVADQDAGDPPDTLTANVVFSFTIDTPPSVTATMPTNGATQVAANTAITVTFSEAVNADAGNVTLQCNGMPAAFTLSASPAAVFTLTPTSALPAGKLCTVAIPPGAITDVDAGDPPDTMGSSYVFSFTIDAAPSVTVTAPANGATKTTANANLTVTFSEPVNVAGNWFQVACATTGTRNVADTVVTGGPTTFTINPNVNFAGGETCAVTVFAALVGDQDAADPPDAPTADFVFSFTTDAAPSVTSTTPANGATVASNTNLSITFSEAVATAGASYTVSCAASGAHTFVLSGGSTTWTLNPNADFTPGETCTLTVLAAGVTDQDADDPPDNMVANHVVSFTIHAMPFVTATTPANGALGVATRANLTVTFSEPVNVTGLWFAISCSRSNTRYPLNTVVSGGPTVFSIDPNVNFGSGETCTVTMFAAQVTDQNAIDPPIGMAANYVFSFTVDQPPSVTTTVPAYATWAEPDTTITINFTERVNATTSSFGVACDGVAQTFTLSASPAASFVLTPTAALQAGTRCSVTVFAAQITPTEGGDSRESMLANHVLLFLLPLKPANDSRTVTGNVPIDTAVTGFSVLANDDINPDTIVSFFDATSVRGGTVSMNATGVFTYTPPVGYEGTDSFNYTIKNANNITALATVTLTVSEMVWFIDNASGPCTTIAGGCGRRATPFSTLAAFEAVNGGVTMNGGDVIDPEAGEPIFIATGAGNYVGPLTLEANQRVIGQGATSTLGTLAGITFAPDSVSVPVSGGTAPTISGAGIALASNNRLHGLAFNLQGTLSTAVKGASNVGTFTMSDIAVRNASGPGISFTGGGTVTATGVNTIAAQTRTALEVSNTTIGAEGLTFRSISGGEDWGIPFIILNNTGLGGGLSVTGTGAMGSGGGTMGKTYLTNTANVSLSWMELRGIVGQSVTNFSVTNSSIGQAGYTNGPYGPAIAFGTSNPSGTNGLQGTGLIDNCQIIGGIRTNLEFYNQSGSMNLAISNSSILFNNQSTGLAGILSEMQGTASATYTIQGNTFTHTLSRAVRLAANDSSSITATLTGNEVIWSTNQGNEGLSTEGFVLSNGSNGRLTATITNNTFSGLSSMAIFVGQTAGDATAASELRATITGNVITTAIDATNHAIVASLTSTTGQVSQARLLINDNTVTQSSLNGVGHGILVDAPDTSLTPEYHATVTGNTVHVLDSVAGVAGVVVQARNGATGHFDVRDNTVDFPNGTPDGVPGVRVGHAALATAELAQGVSVSSDPFVVLETNNPLSTTEIIGAVTVIPDGGVLLP